MGGLWWAVPVDVVLVSNISEEPYLALRYEHGHTQSMYRRISKSLVVEAASSIQPVKVSFIRFAAEEVQIPNLEVREELAVVVVSAIVGVKQPVQVGIRMYQLWMGVDERASARPERRKGASVVEDIHVETVFHVVIAHEAEDIVVNVAEEVDIRLNPPIPVKILEPWMLVEESTVPTAHVSIADHPSFPNSNGTQVFQAIHEPPLINPVRQGPMLFRHDFVIAFGRREILCSSPELITKWLIIEEDPRIVVLPIPLEFQLSHTLHQTRKLRVAHQADERSTRFTRVMTERRYRLQQTQSSVLCMLVVRILL